MNTTKTGLLAILVLAMTASAVTTQSWAETFSQKHPRRAEVLHRDHHEMKRDQHMNRELNADKGHLGGHYNQLKREDHSIARQDAAIKRQEQWDAKHDNGHITKAEDRQLNREENRVHREENHLQHQINRDHQ